MRASGLPVLLKVNNVWDSSLITWDPLLKRAGLQQEPGSGQQGGKVGSRPLFLIHWAWLKLFKPVCHCMSTTQSLFELSLFVRLPLSQRSLIIVLRRAYWLCYVVVRECWFSVLHERLVFVLFCLFRCQCTHSGCVAYSGGQSNLTWSSFNWQIEWISLTTSIGSHGTLLYLTQWEELTCHLRGLQANSVSFFHSQTLIHLRKLFLSSSLCLPPPMFFLSM